MPRKGIVHLTTTCNAIIRTGYFPVQWKVAQIIMIPKPGKPLEDASPFQMSKIVEKAMHKKLCSILENRMPRTISLHFDRNHRTNTVNYRNNKSNFKKKKNYCSATFLDITHTSDKILHQGLLFKIRKVLPMRIAILESYLTDRLFQRLNPNLKKTEASVLSEAS
jgi:hypothetical protein